MTIEKPQQSIEEEKMDDNKLTERVHTYKPLQPTHRLEASFLETKPGKEVEELTAEEITEKVVEKHEDKNIINPLHFFNYQGVEIKIGEMKSLNKVLFEIKVGDQRKDGWFSQHDIKDNVNLILQEAEKLLESAENEK